MEFYINLASFGKLYVQFSIITVHGWFFRWFDVWVYECTVLLIEIDLDENSTVSIAGAATSVLHQKTLPMCHIMILFHNCSRMVCRI
jgi:hypothetical protein